MIILISSGITEGLAAEPAFQDPYQIEITPGFTLQPIQAVSLRSYYFGSDPGDGRYCLENSEGDCLKEGPTTFLDWSGGAAIFKALALHYEAQVGDTDHFRFKKALAQLRTGPVSWELGKDSLWIGQGYHGSLLFSNNAEGFFLFKFETVDPFRLPGSFLSRAGEFRYLFFHGWLEDFKTMGHRLSWGPSSLIEIGFNQIIVYKNRFKIWEFPKVFAASEENVAGRFDNDQRASLDIALYLPFLKRVTPFQDGKIYGEYAGEDLRAWWQKEDRWEPPLGFDYLFFGSRLGGRGTMGGLFLTTGTTDIRFEYSQNYRSINSWYSKIPFENNGILMGHHMSREADDLFFEVTRRWGLFSSNFSFDRERHGLKTFPDNPEIRNQFAVKSDYPFNRFILFSHLVYSRYTNVDEDPDALGINIQKGTDREEFSIGFGLMFR